MQCEIIVCALECCMFSGTVIRLGEELSIDTPVNRVLYHGIKVKEAENERLCSGSCTR